MTHRRHQGTRTALKTAALALFVTPPAALLGCSHPTAPIAAPSGGQTLVLSLDQFTRTVEPVLSQNGCDAGGDCHGGGIRGTLELSPASAKNAQFDFDQVSLQVSAVTPDSSRILTKPLALVAGGVPHSVKVFATTGDPGYQAIRQWIMDGAPR